MPDSPLVIEPVHEISDLQKVLDLETRVWEGTEPVPVSLLRVFAQEGGLVLLAFWDGQPAPVGMAVAFSGRRHGQWYLHSHMLAVLPAFRRLSVGRALKHYQLQYAAEHDMEYVGWTFDPLQRKNAHLNLNVLGGVATDFYPNFYGVLGDAINGEFPSHRLFIEWGGSVPSTGSGRFLAIPDDIDAVRRIDPQKALWWAGRIQRKMEVLMSRNYVVVGIVSDRRDRWFYQLQRRSG